jgi:hypothetical protein
MTFADNPYNRRQLVMMRRSIEEFRTGSMGLGQLIVNLEGLFFCIESPDPYWSEQFQVSWATLEEVYAAMIHRRTKLDAEAEALVGQSTDELLTLVEHALGAKESGDE